MRAMTRDIRQDQTGLVSIVVTMIMMVIMSLIIIGFARISRRELRQGLDRQLVSQANYAAESGVNDAQAYLRGGGTLSTSAATTCNSYTSTGGLPKAQEIGDPSIVTSCVLVDSTTEELIYDNVGTDSEVVFPLKSADPINHIAISWDAGNGAKFDPAQCQGTSVQLQDGLVPAGSWTCPVGGLRIDILPIDTISPNRLALLIANSSALVMPRPSGPTSRNLSTLNTLQQFTTACSASATPRSCNLTINTSGSEREFYVRIRPIYQSANLYIQGLKGIGNPADLTGAQAVIDSTGRASDVLKRLVVRVPTCPSTLECGKRPASSGTALQLAETLCKQYGVIPPSTVTAPSSPAQCQLP